MVFGPIKLASGFFGGVRVVDSFSYLYCPMYVSLCSEFRVICVCLGIVLSNTYCVVFLLCFSSSCVPYVAGFSVLFFVLCTLCYQFLCSFLRLVYLMLPVSLFFSSSCVPYVASFSRLLIF